MGTAFTSSSVSHLDAFAAEPVMQRRVELVQAIKTGSFGKSWVDDYVKRLGDEPDLAAQWTAAQKLMAGESAAMELDTPEKQLVWACALALEKADGQPSGPVYKTYIEHSVARAEKQTAAARIDASLHDSGVTVSWGQPGSWFWFMSETRHVNLDPLYSLAVGFEHARSVMAHEIGHSQLSLRFSDTMMALKEKSDALREKAKKEQLTPEEFAQIKRTEAEFNLRAGFYNAGEDACVNRYAVQRGNDYQQDMAASLNRVSFVLQGAGAQMLHKAGQPLLPPQKTPALEAEQQLDHLCKAFNLAFFTSSGLLANTPEDWRKVGVEPEAIRKLAKGKQSGDGFEKLVAASVGRDGLAELQPTSFDYRLFSFMFRTRASRYADHRNKLMDGLWDTYAADQAKIVLDAIEQQTLEQTKAPPQDNRNGKNGQNGQQNGQQNQPQGSSGSNGGGGQQEQSDSSSSSDSKEGSSGGPPSRPSSEGQGGGGSDSASPNKQQAQNGGSDEGRTEPKKPDGGFQTGKPQDGHKGSKPAGEEKGKDKGESVQVQGAGEMRLPERLPASPGEARQREQPEAADDKTRELDAETIAELLRAAREGRLERASLGSAPAPSGSPAGSFASISDNQGSAQRGVDLAKLANADWTQYQARVNELGPFITQVERKLDYVRSQQVHQIRTLSDQRVEMPVDGDILRRLDQQANFNLQLKLRTGQPVDKRDRARWRPDSVKVEPTTSEVLVLIDGSGSMDYGLPGGGKRIWSAVQSGAVIYEASKRAKFDTFVGIWGDNQLRMMINPGDDAVKVGRAFEAMKDGINSGTILSSNLQQSAQALSKHRNLNGSAYSGHTHVLIISDGELNGGDDKPCIRMLEQLYKLGRYVTVDIAILGGARGTALHGVAQALSSRGNNYRVNVVQGDDPNEIPLQLSKLLERRFREGGGAAVHAIPDAVKRQNLARAARAMARVP